jgi:hypothetical protein
MQRIYEFNYGQKLGDGLIDKQGQSSSDGKSHQEIGLCWVRGVVLFLFSRVPDWRTVLFRFLYIFHSFNNSPRPACKLVKRVVETRII